MKNTVFVKVFVLIMTFLLLLCTIFMVVVDPFFQYHKPWFGMKPYVVNERYQAAGMARNFDYDNLIFGNSMSQNFRASRFNTLGGTSVKITMSGSCVLDWSYVFDILLNDSRIPKNIILSLDPIIFEGSTTELRHALPTYLYDENILNDVKYVLSFSNFFRYGIEGIVHNLANTVPEIDEAFVWDNGNVCSAKQMLETYTRPEKTETTRGSVNNFLITAEKNTRILLEYIDKMPETEFIFFVSPFSILYWDTCNQSDSLEMWEQAYLSNIGLLLEHDNVRICFDVTDNLTSTICDLDNYRDYSHYSMDISEEIADRICSGKGYISELDYEQKITEFFDFLKSFDYDSFYQSVIE